jgi:diguanylate cyclase (GGDEF)-like protein
MSAARNSRLLINNSYRQLLESILNRKGVLVGLGVFASLAVYFFNVALYNLTGNVQYVWLIFSAAIAISVLVISINWTRIAFLQRDITTGLYSRLYIEELLNRLEGSNNDVTIAIIDINSLREVNNKNGHHAGDQLLISTAKRLHLVIGRQQGRCVGRLGGDEFVVVATGKISCCDLADEVEEALHARHPLDDVWGLGCGGVSRTRHGETRTALECADMALLRAKKEYYQSKRARVLQYDSVLDGMPNVDRRPIHRLRDTKHHSSK